MMPTAVDPAAVAAMSRDEKVAFVKKLKEERRSLYRELGIEEEPKVEEAPAAEKAHKLAPPPPPFFVHVFKCLGMQFTMTVANEASEDAAAEADADKEPPKTGFAAAQHKVAAKQKGAPARRPSAK